MSGHPSDLELEEIVDGTVVPPHATRCARCRRKLALLRVERELLRRAAARDASPIEPLWPGVQARIDRHRRNRRIVMSALAAAAAAVIVALSPWRSADVPPVTAGARAALDRAEGEYLHAIQVLESRVELREQALPSPALEARRSARARTRAAIAHARAPEPAGRMRQLEGYAAYLRSLRRELDEAP